MSPRRQELPRPSRTQRWARWDAKVGYPFKVHTFSVCDAWSMVSPEITQTCLSNSELSPRSSYKAELLPSS